VAGEKEWNAKQKGTDHQLSKRNALCNQPLFQPSFPIEFPPPLFDFSYPKETDVEPPVSLYRRSYRLKILQDVHLAAILALISNEHPAISSAADTGLKWRSAGGARCALPSRPGPLGTTTGQRRPLRRKTRRPPLSSPFPITSLPRLIAPEKLGLTPRRCHRRHGYHVVASINGASLVRQGRRCPPSACLGATLENHKSSVRSRLTNSCLTGSRVCMFLFPSAESFDASVHMASPWLPVY
jgi:hypothetical protein